MYPPLSVFKKQDFISSDCQSAQKFAPTGNVYLSRPFDLFHPYAYLPKIAFYGFFSEALRSLDGVLTEKGTGRAVSASRSFFPIV